MSEQIETTTGRPREPFLSVRRGLKPSDLEYVKRRIAKLAAFIEDEPRQAHRRALIILDDETILLLNRHLNDE